MMRPREGHGLRMETCSFEISLPHRLRWMRDLHENNVGLIDFTEPAADLIVEADFTLDIFERNPFAFILIQEAADYPFFVRSRTLRGTPSANQKYLCPRRGPNSRLARSLLASRKNSRDAGTAPATEPAYLPDIPLPASGAERSSVPGRDTQKQRGIMPRFCHPFHGDLSVHGLGRQICERLYVLSSDRGTNVDAWMGRGLPSWCRLGWLRSELGPAINLKLLSCRRLSPLRARPSHLRYILRDAQSLFALTNRSLRDAD